MTDLTDAERVNAYLAKHPQWRAQLTAAREVLRATELDEELATLLQADRSLMAAFESLTPGRAREFAQHVAGAKRAATRVSRAQQSAPLIRAGVGLHDKYRSR